MVQSYLVKKFHTFKKTILLLIVCGLALQVRMLKKIVGNG